MCNRRERGLSLIEVVVFIVVLGIGLAGMAILYNQLTLSSVDPMVRKQAVAIANSLMEEVQLRPFTYCDPDDPLVYTAANPGACGIQELMPPGNEQAETRSGATPFDNVNDYNTFSLPAGIQDVNGTPITGLEAYTARVDIVNAGADFPAAVPAAEALRIDVTVDGPASIQVILRGYRLRYAPRSP